MFIGAGALLLILLVVGIGGFFAYKFLKGNDNETSESTNTNPANGTTVEAQRFGRYWLELLPETLIGEPVRVRELFPSLPNSHSSFTSCSVRTDICT